jgi:hypothetical protein
VPHPFAFFLAKGWDTTSVDCPLLLRYDWLRAAERRRQRIFRLGPHAKIGVGLAKRHPPVSANDKCGRQR